MAIPSSRQEFKDHCTPNKYSVWYFALMEKASNRGWERKTSSDYIEGHHVVPRSISGDTMRTGEIVFLTAREHFIAHLLLPKMLSGKQKQKMQLALHRLTTGNGKNYCKSSHLYESIKKQHAEAASSRSTDYWASLTKEQRSAMRAGENNSRWGAIVTESTRQKIRVANTGRFSKEKHPLWGVGHSEETKRKMSANRKGCVQLLKWFNDGENQYFVLPEKALAHWNKGTLSHLNPMYGKVGAAAGKKWFHNPVTKQEKYFIPGNQPDGFIQGRL